MSCAGGESRGTRTSDRMVSSRDLKSLFSWMRRIRESPILSVRERRSFWIESVVEAILALKWKVSSCSVEEYFAMSFNLAANYLHAYAER